MQQAKRQKAQDIQRKNIHPHRLSRGGYEKLEEKMMKETSSSLPSDDSVVSSVTRPSRHDKWKRARQNSSGNYLSEQTNVVAQRIVSSIS